MAEEERLLWLLAQAVSILAVIGLLVQLRRERKRHEFSAPRVVSVREPVVTNKAYEPQRGRQLHLIADFRAIGNVVIAETWLIAGNPKAASAPRRKGRKGGLGGSGRSEVLDGRGEVRRWPLVYIRDHLPTNKPWSVWWQNTAGELVSGEPVPDAYRDQFIDAKTEAEQASDQQ